ncbi:MAG: PLP-dependent aminotransferase family protein [Actinomycetota bacterium]|nr:PLP-dependent aminotransferase family protein [Actinomycetota bacterium]
MERHRVGPQTVQRTVAALVREGLVEARPGSGTFVSTQPQRSAADVSWQTVALGSRPMPGEALSELTIEPSPGVLSLATGYGDATLWPTALLARATAAASRRPDAWGRSPAHGISPLRSWFAGDAGAGARPDEVLVVAGGQAGLSAAFRSLASPGDPIILESPTYVGAIEAAKLAGLRPVPIPVDEHGMRTDLLDAVMQSSGARLVYVQPRLANPTGATLAPDRRAELLDAARAAGAFVVEDDYARDLDDNLSISSLFADDVDGHVIYLRSLTKSAAPALRIAGITARGPALQRLRNARLVDDFFVSAVLQEAAIGVVSAYGWTRHLQRLRRDLGERMAVCASSLAHLPDVEVVGRPSCGFFLWVRLQDGADDVDVARRARAGGVLVSAGRRWAVSEPDGSYLRLSIAAITAGEVPEAIARLATALPIAGWSPARRLGS